MAMEISNTYSSYVNNSTYATKNNDQKKIDGSNATDKTSLETNSSTMKTAADELSYISNKYTNYSFVAADYSKGMKYGSSSTVNVAISPQFLSKMASDSALEKEYESYITDMQAIDERLISQEAAKGWKLETVWAIDKDGGISKWMIGTKDPNAKSHLQKMSENAQKIRERNAEKKKNQDEIDAKHQASKDEKEKLKEKIKEAGKMQLGDMFKDAVVIMKDEAEENSGKNARRVENIIGVNLDTKI